MRTAQNMNEPHYLAAAATLMCDSTHSAEVTALADFAEASCPTVRAAITQTPRPQRIGGESVCRCAIAQTGSVKRG